MEVVRKYAVLKCINGIYIWVMNRIELVLTTLYVDPPFQKNMEVRWVALLMEHGKETACITKYNNVESNKETFR